MLEKKGKLKSRRLWVCIYCCAMLTAQLFLPVALPDAVNVILAGCIATYVGFTSVEKNTIIKEGK